MPLAIVGKTFVMKYAVRITVLPKGGILSTVNNKIHINGADEVVILLTADTDYCPNYDPDFSDPSMAIVLAG